MNALSDCFEWDEFDLIIGFQEAGDFGGPWPCLGWFTGHVGSSKLIRCNSAIRKKWEFTLTWKFQNQFLREILIGFHVRIDFETSKYYILLAYFSDSEMSLQLV